MREIGKSMDLWFRREREREKKDRKKPGENIQGIIVLLVVDELYLPIEGLFETVDED